MKHNIIIILLIFTSLFTLSSCGSSTSQEDNDIYGAWYAVNKYDFITDSPVPNFSLLENGTGTTPIGGQTIFFDIVDDSITIYQKSGDASYVCGTYNIMTCKGRTCLRNNEYNVFFFKDKELVIDYIESGYDPSIDAK